MNYQLMDGQASKDAQGIYFLLTLLLFEKNLDGLWI